MTKRRYVFAVALATCAIVALVALFLFSSAGQDKADITKASYDLIALESNRDESHRILGVPGNYSKVEFAAVQRFAVDGEYPFPGIVFAETKGNVELIFSENPKQLLGTIEKWQGDEVMIQLTFRQDGTLARKELVRGIVFGGRRERSLARRIREFLAKHVW